MSELTSQTPTIGSFADRGMDVRCWCCRCHHYAVIPIGDVAAKLGRDRPFPEIAPYLRCTVCGARAGQIQPDWPPVAMGVG